MNFHHYLGLYPAYFSALICWTMIASYYKLNDRGKSIEFQRPWLEFALAILAVIFTLLIGQLYMKSMLLPRPEGLGILFESINQTLIFSPFILLLVLRKQSPRTAWIPAKDKLRSMLIGIALALIAIFVFLLSKGKLAHFFPALKSAYSPDNAALLVQVFLEDFAIAICFIRFKSIIGKKWSIAVVGILFAMAHIPAMMSDGITYENAFGLLADSALGIFALIVLSRSKNILWFWMVHFALDMMQFYELLE